MNNDSYPALFRSADKSSSDKQALYLNLIRAEYATLILAAVFAMDIFADTAFYVAYAFVFVLSVASLLTRATLAPEQDWYKCRALAESVKTLTWRYVMRAAPFGDAPELQVPRAEFRNQLHRMFDANRATAEMISSNWSADDQITTEMNRIRALSLDERKSYYAEHRVHEQRVWYARKAGANKAAARRWMFIGIGAYTFAALLVLSRIGVTVWHIWPVEPTIVFASSIIGWTQIKKFNELSAAYTVTAHEIGMIRPLLDDANSESKFSDFVNHSELAFSREHTFWIARPSN